MAVPLDSAAKDGRMESQGGALMKGELPVVRLMALCENIQYDEDNIQRVCLQWIINKIYSQESPPFPLLYEELCVMLFLTECTGVNTFSLQIAHLDSGTLVYQTEKPWERDFGDDPWRLSGFLFESITFCSRSQETTRSSSFLTNRSCVTACFE